MEKRIHEEPNTLGDYLEKRVSADCYRLLFHGLDLILDQYNYIETKSAYIINQYSKIKRLHNYFKPHVLFA